MRIFINELHYDNKGGDVGEFVEVGGPADADLDGFSLVLYNGSNGQSYNTIALQGALLGDGEGFGVRSFATPGIQNGAPDGLALVDPKGVVLEFLSYEGSFTAADGPAAGMISTDIGVQEGDSTPIGHSLQRTGTGTDGADFSWTGPLPDTRDGTNTGQTYAPAADGGETTTPQNPGETPGENPDETPGETPGETEITLISQIQGAGDASPMVGRTVTVEAIVVGDFQNGDGDAGRSLGGFFLQEEDTDSDGNALTSEGIFVFEGALGTDVKLGDKVRVTGVVGEHFGETQLSQISAVEIVSSGNPLPSAAVIALPAAGTTLSQNGAVQPDLEAFEGMRVVVEETLTITEQYQLDRFNEIKLFDTNGFEQAGPAGTTLTGERPFQFTQFNRPDAAGNAAYLEKVGARTITYDDGLNQQNQPIGNLDGFQNYSTATAPRMGDTVTGLAGILDYKWAGNAASGATWRIRSTEDGTNRFENANPRPVGTVSGEGTLKVAAFNVLNFLTTLDQFPDTAADNVGPNLSMEPRGADTNPQGAVSGVGPTDEYDRQLSKLVEAISGLGADVLSLIELENDFRAGGAAPGDQSAQLPRPIAIEALVEALNAREGAPVWAAVDPGSEFVGSDAIAVGMIYRTDTVRIAEGTSPAILTDANVDQSILARSTVDNNGSAPGGSVFDGPSTSRSPMAVTFQEIASGETLTVVANHLKSKGGNGQGLDADQGDGAANYNNMRVLAVEALDAWLKTNPTGSDTANIMLVGDFNAYASEDPVQYLTDVAGFVDVAAELLGTAYSYLFDGLLGTLDYTFASIALFNQIVDAVAHMINADEADALDYNLEFGRDPSIFDADVPFRSSDHDPVVVSMDLSGPDTPLNVPLYDGPSFAGSIEPTKAIELEALSQTTGLAGAEIAAYDAASRQLLVSSSAGLQYLDISDPKAPTLTRLVDLTAMVDPATGAAFATTDITSVAAKNGLIAVALPAADKTEPGRVVFLNAAGEVLGSIAVGSLPDMLTFTPDGTKLLVANEGEPSEGYTVDPEGSISVIDLSQGVGNATVRTADFSAFDGQENALRAAGVRIFEGRSVSHDVEPEHIAVTPDGTKALVTLQEANAVAVLDVASATVTDIVPLGGKSFADLMADFSDRDGAKGKGAIELTTGNPVIGQFMPDAISSYTAGDGKVYFVTANEGDDRDDFLPGGETVRVKNDAYVLDAETYPNADSLKQDAQLGRLNVSNAPLLDGDTDGDGDVDQILTYGARSFSILDADGRMVFDSGDAIERIVAREFPELFDDGRSDNKGPEPEGVTVAEIGGRSYAFVGLERANLSLVFDVTDPTNVTYTTAAKTPGDVAPEGTLMISAKDSPTGKALYVSPNEKSQTLSIYEASVAKAKPFTLEVLHFSDQEASSGAVKDAPNLSAVLNALRAQDLGDDGVADNTLTLSSGDMFIPGVFADAGRALYGSQGVATFQIQNELGIQASTLGNHEFDRGTKLLADLISGVAGGAILGADYAGTAFPFISANLDFSGDANLAPLVIEGGQAPRGGVIAPSTVIDVNGEMIGIVGATTPMLARLSSAGGVVASPASFSDQPSAEQLDALAAVIQTEVDALIAANPGMNKVILSSHMQSLSIEEALATRLSNVDIIIAGGSNTRLLDDNDRLRDGDSAQGRYPIFATDADGHTIAVVNTDGSYKYVGRLVVDFDENGHIIADSYDPNVSGAYATDDAGVEALGARDLVDPEIQQIANEIGQRIAETESNIFGRSEVFLNGNRAGTAAPGDLDGVRTQETNLGNLTADGNLAYANKMAQLLGEEEPVLVSIKNGGGIRASIGQITVPAGGTQAVRLPNEALFDAKRNLIKPEGGISQNDIQTTLAFNNGLTLLTLTRADLAKVMEDSLSGLPRASGGFMQMAGIEMSYDPNRPAGERVRNAAIVDASGEAIANLVVDGKIAGDPDQTFRVVTLDFLANAGDGIGLATGERAKRLDLTDLDRDGVADNLRTGEATFAADGSEQDALAEYLAANFRDTPFSEADRSRVEDERMQNLDYREGTVSLVAAESGPILGTADDDILVGTAGDDEIDGLDGDDRIEGLAGDDTLRGGEGDDIILGGAGDDTIEGGAGDDVLQGGAGNDILIGGAGRDLIYGDEGDDLINVAEASPEADIVFAGAGDDTVVAGRYDRIDGGAGYDRAIVNFALGGVAAPVVLLANAAGAMQANDGTFITGFEAVELTLTDGNDAVNSGNVEAVVNAGAGDDLVRTGSGNDWLFGGAGNDILSGGAGDDHIDGGTGDDILVAGAGNDTLVGGEGVDTAVFLGQAADFTFERGQNGAILVSDTAEGGEGVNSLDGIEILRMAGVDYTLGETGSSGNDILFADLSGDRLAGGSGDDILVGGPGNDTLLGGSGNDLLQALEGDNWLDGGSGDDLIVSGAGDDTIRGGSGDDRIVLGGGSDTVDGGSGEDVVVLKGAIADYQGSRSLGGFDLVSAEQSASIRGVERLVFDDGEVDLSDNGAAFDALFAPSNEAQGPETGLPWDFDGAFHFSSDFAASAGELADLATTIAGMDTASAMERFALEPHAHDLGLVA